MIIRNYKDLKVWQLARLLTREIYEISAQFPDSERFGLTNQIRRAVISIPSNIAEGHSRAGTKDYIHFISIAIGSLAEVETQLILATDLQFIAESETVHIAQNIVQLQKMLHSLRASLKPLIPNP